MRLSAEQVESAQQAHRAPDIYVNDESFPGEMTWRVVKSSAVPSSGKRNALSLTRTIDFTFSGKRSRATANWTEENVSLEDALLPSYVAGDFEGIMVGEQMMDYVTAYRGKCL